MPRSPRIFVPGVPCHVVQRGNNKNPIFFSKQDYYFFLEVLKEAKTKYPCLIYAYCLMANHFHLLIEPKQKDNVSLLMKLLGGKYVRYINKAYGRSGTLWEGRFKCSLIDEESYLSACLRYVEMNPVRAGIVSAPELYRWSSYRFRALGGQSKILDFDSFYNDLGSNLEERRLNYRSLFLNTFSESTCEAIREMTDKGGFVGDINFKNQLEKTLSRKIIIRHPGRPNKSGK